MKEKSNKEAFSWVTDKLGEARYMIVGVSIALIAYLISLPMPQVPGLIIQFIGLIIFAFTMVHTVIRKLYKSANNIKVTYDEAKGRGLDADKE